MINKVIKLFFLATVVSMLLVTNIVALEYVGDNSFLFSVSESEKSTRENNTKISGVIPIINGSTSIAAEVNDKIDEIYTAKIKAAASNRAKEVIFNYKKYQNKNYLSFVITSKTINATEKNEVATINVDLNQLKIINLSDFATNSKISIDVINSYIDFFKANSSVEYNLNFNDINQNSSFYINNDKLYLIFNLGDFNLSAEEIDTLLIPYDKFNKFVLKEDEFYLSANFKSKMIPLRKISELLDYNVGWDEKTSEVTISRGDTFVTLNPNSDIYTFNKKNIILENKPEIKKDATYVPLSFFSDVLGIPYFVGDEGIIFYSFD